MDAKVAHPDARRTGAPPQKRETVRLLRGDSAQQLRQKLDAKVRDHAYRLYQNGGETHGKDSDHWAEAQAKLLSLNLEVRESGPWFHCNCPVQGTPAAHRSRLRPGQQLND
jgi:hypothetical protein